MIAVERRGPTALRPLAVAATVAGAAVLLARPWLVARAPDPTTVLVVAFVAIGVVAVALPLPPVARPAPLATTAAVAAVGVAAFVAGRLLGGGTAAVPALGAYVARNTLAAVAEEALFRRLLYGLLEPSGAAIAVVGSAAAFAAVHLTVWGAWALPVDLAAGLVLSWQRWASGRWSVPAATHAAANLVAVL